MIDPEDRKRWQAMAAELGLPPDEEEPSAPVQAAPEPEVEEPRTEFHEPEPIPEGPPNRGRRRRGHSPVVETRAEEPVKAAPEVPAAKEASIEPSIPEPAEPSTAVKEAPEAKEPAPEDQRPARRRRRGRRGSKQEAETETEPTSGDAALVTGTEDESPAEAATEAPEGESSEEPTPRRGRRRGRTRKGERESEPTVTEEAAETVEEEEEVVSEEPPRVEEDDDEEVDDLSNWNVPSWQELIASLYRPERGG
jgi:hypothetical protein